MRIIVKIKKTKQHVHHPRCAFVVETKKMGREREREREMRSWGKKLRDPNVKWGPPKWEVGGMGEWGPPPPPL
jgi:hypothetical protein